MSPDDKQQPDPGSSDAPEPLENRSPDVVRETEALFAAVDSNEDGVLDKPEVADAVEDRQARVDATKAAQAKVLTQPEEEHRPDNEMLIIFDRRNVWRTAWLIVGVIALTMVLKWVLADGGSVIFTLAISFLLSVAMEPAVAKLAKYMKRGLATAIVMLGVLVAAGFFLFIFGRLLSDQIGTFVQQVPSIVESVTNWANEKFGADLDVQTILDKLGIGTSTLTTMAQNLAGGVFGVISAIFSAAFGAVTMLFFTYYFSADGPRLRRWIAQLFPPKQQQIFGTAWDLAVIKTGGYVSARVVLAAINGGTTALVMLLIGMPYWLALGIWTGVIAQLIPNIGTYISIALPVLIGLIGEKPWQGLVVLGWALLYQQIENVTIEPRISAQAVDVHPAVSFGAVLLGASLFGVSGAFVAVPVAALLLAMFEIYSRKYELLPHLAELQPGESDPDDDDDDPDGTDGPGGGSGPKQADNPRAESTGTPSLFARLRRRFRSA